MIEALKNKLRSDMGKDILLTFCVQLLIMLSSFAINKILSNRMSVDDFGQYNVVKRSASVLSFVMLAGTGIALPRYIALYRGQKLHATILSLLHASVAYVLLVSLVLVLACVVFSDHIQQLVIGPGGDSWLYYIAIGYAFSFTLASFIYAYYRGQGRFRHFNFCQLLVQLSIVVPLLVLPVVSSTRVFLSWLAITLFIVIVYFTYELFHTRFILFRRRHLAGIRQQFTIIVKYSSGRLVGDFFYFSLSAFPLVYLSQHTDLASVAYYSVGLTFVNMATPVFTFMGIILLPYVSRSMAEGKSQQANRFIRKLTLIYLAAAAAITIVFYVFIRLLIRLFFSSDYLVADELSRMLIFSILPQAIYLLYKNPIDAVSVVPFNTFILGGAFVLMFILFHYAHTLPQYSWAFVVTSVFQARCAWVVWWHHLRLR